MSSVEDNYSNKKTMVLNHVLGLSEHEKNIQVCCVACGSWILEYNKDINSWIGSSDYIVGSDICRVCKKLKDK